jgi:hypothetical protein
VSATNAFDSDSISVERKKSIRRTFSDTPFKGGASYVNFYRALPRTVERRDRLRMDKIRYESPGYVNVNGDHETFQEVAHLIKSFVRKRAKIKKLYTTFHQSLSKNRYLQMTGASFRADDTNAESIRMTAASLATEMGMPNLDVLDDLVQSNWLVYAKLILSFYRRLEESSKYFAQGRMAFK